MLIIGEIMKIIHGAANFQYIKNRPALAIALGNFDGLHIAHKKIVDRTREIARAKNLKCAIFLLDPHPASVLFPQSDLFLLSTVAERAEKLDKWGMDYLIIEDFTPEFSMLSPYSFVKDYLAGFLNVSEIIVGYDYSFGARGQGTPNELLKWSEELGYNVEIMPPVMLGSEVVSSSLIRELILKGEVKGASVYLGDYFTRTGRVVHGDGRGRHLGYPTANLETPPGLIIPGNGVYLTLAEWKGKQYFSLTNIGSKPTFMQGNEIVVEVYLMDFSGNLYGEELTLKFLNKIRKEKYFSEVCFLIRQIKDDEKRARELIAEEYAKIL